MNFKSFDFKRLTSPDFKEDSVREELILPMVQQLGYQSNQIIRSKTLKHPYIKIGSKKRPVNIVPDYLFKVGESYAWVLDAKAPDEEIKHGDNVEQVYSYATHPEVRTKFFALCNGWGFALYRQDATSEPILYFELADIAKYWEQLTVLLSPDAFQIGKTYTYISPKLVATDAPFDYLNRPLLEEVLVKKRTAKRHFGVHGYFTKQTWNVVNAYIQNFSQKGDVVLDPFGGSGVTAIEAMMTDRKAINLDINPMSIFIVDSLTAPVKINELQSAFEQIKAEYVYNEPKTESEINTALSKYDYPKDWPLPKGSDVKVVQDLFSKKQLAQLGYLKHLIKKVSDKNLRNSLLLMFSGLLTKVNLTYHTSKIANKDGQGDASAFRYYRYRIAPTPIDIDVMKYFELRLKKIVAAKREIEYKINLETIANLKIVQGTATKLDFIKKESVDYIYTDPPYGKKNSLLRFISNVECMARFTSY